MKSTCYYSSRRIYYCVVPGERRRDAMNYMTASQAAKKWKISQRRVQILCSEGRIPGVFKLGEAWAIPDDVEKPDDKRRKDEKSNEQL